MNLHCLNKFKLTQHELISANFPKSQLKRQFNAKPKVRAWQKIYNLLKQLLRARWFVLSKDTQQLLLATEFSGNSGEFGSPQRQTTSVELTLLYLLQMLLLSCWKRAVETAKRNIPRLDYSASYPIFSKIITLESNAPGRSSPLSEQQALPCPEPF